MENKFIIIIVVTLFLIALAQLMKVYDLASKVKGEKSEEIITKQENTFNAFLFLVFMVSYFSFVIWLIMKFGMNGGLFESGSAHGQETDGLLLFNWYIIIPVFFLTNSVLFIFAWKYRYKKERKALYYPHNNKLEFIWTVVPAIALSCIIIYGLKIWNEVMFSEDKDAKVVEIYAERFAWKIRYAGEDNVLGKADYKLITGNNPTGIITHEYIQETYTDIENKIDKLNTFLNENSKDGEGLLPTSQVDSCESLIETLQRQKYRIKATIDKGSKEENTELYKASYDDIISSEFRLIKDQPYSFRIRSKDVMHSVFVPHFRMQMNAVPGMETKFNMTPVITTDEMRLKPEVQEHYRNLNILHNERLKSLGEPEEEVEFNYILMCNKICGSAHYNMQKNIIVETKEEFNTWLSDQKTTSDQLSDKLALKE